MRDRLIEIFHKVNYQNRPNGMTANLATQFTDYALGEIVDALLAEGVFVPPCKVGDTVWFETYENNGRDCIGVQPHIVDKTYFVAVVEGKPVHTNLYDWYFGKTVFLTREEAEKSTCGKRGKG